MKEYDYFLSPLPLWPELTRLKAQVRLCHHDAILVLKK